MSDPIHVITANRTDDGAVVYLSMGPEGPEWSESLAMAEILKTSSAAEDALAFAQQQECLVTDPYLLRVNLVDGQPVSASARERIREGGPEATLRRLGYLRNGNSRPAAAAPRGQLELTAPGRPMVERPTSDDRAGARGEGRVPVQ